MYMVLKSVNYTDLSSQEVKKESLSVNYTAPSKRKLADQTPNIPSARDIRVLHLFSSRLGEMADPSVAGVCSSATTLKRQNIELSTLPML
jgi:hypothetical protein